ncbi:DNA polymerase I,DNA polymerase I,DNA polymerase I - 3'-5' exonuclease and polymerase domains,DNA polymerase I,DNA polymerase family A [Chlamydia poikilotherma]|uniref:DNA polymerase I n=1 Tax=Chlamydia poikilotherma TaxID=1967783 RepID=A0A3B0PLM8_9CHLA|nr:DNA polymerase I [Chlamydia poikilotherma]SYX08619.1 DNA polymerase I,DNA polymerase I,DNA polymerase I - 3'-5' exonuclease and polymerase domains,DNA polymerase I,DNA polymerase family A [Chlamydia poikilotherma]
MRKIFILDASGFVFRAYFALPDMKNSSGEGTQAVFGFIRSINKLIKEFSPDHMVAVFDGPNNKQSRREIYADYKSNREQKEENLYQQIPVVKEYCSLLGLTYLEVEGVEADDVIASAAKQAVLEGYEVCICTADKDLLQLVGSNVIVLNPWKDQSEIDHNRVIDIYGIPPTGIPDYLALVGDTSDNIPGVSGCGPKKATTLLQKYHSVEGILENLDELTGSTHKMLSEQKDILLLSKDLAVLNDKIPLPIAIDALKFPLREVPQEEMNTFYMRQGFKTLVQQVEEESNVDVVVINNSKKLSQELSHLRGKSVAFSVGYKGSFLPSLTLMGVALACDDAVYYVDIENALDDLLTPLKDFFRREDTEFYGYNIKRDNHALKNAGIHVNHIALDLALAEHLINGGAKISYQTLLVDHGLVSAAGRYGKEWGQLSLPILKSPVNPAQYFGEFVSHLPRIKKSLLEELKIKKVEDLFFNMEMPLEKVLFTIERNGMPLDVEDLQELERILSEELAILTDDIYTLAGTPFNIKSPKQLSDILYNKLGLTPLDKARSTKAEVLEALSGEHEIIEKILAFRAVEKLLSTYVKALPRQVDPHTSRIHPTFNQMGTVTGRLACQDPNLQNIPIRSERGRLLRKAFCDTHQNNYFLSADYSQIELRFLAHLSQDESLKLAFESREDVHTFTASQVFHVPLEEVTKQQRMQAKTVNFGIIYGQQAYGLSKILKISVSEAQKLIDAYFDRYPEVARFINETVSQACENLRVKTLLGRERIIDNWTEFSNSRAASGRLAVNTRIQGSAAELIKLAMLQLFDALEKRKLRSRMLLQIHDELIFEVPEDEKEEMQTLVRDIMESAMILSVPLVVNILIGKNWAEC